MVYGWNYINGVLSGNRFEKPILTGKWKCPVCVAVLLSNAEIRVGSADHTISSLVCVQRDYYVCACGCM